MKRGNGCSAGVRWGVGCCYGAQPGLSEGVPARFRCGGMGKRFLPGYGFGPGSRLRCIRVSSCYDSRNPQRVKGKDVLGGLLPNRRLGMPVAEDTPWGFDEYEVRAGEVITFEMGDRSYHWQDRVSCHLSGVYFVPEPGKKYEVFKDRKLCNIRIRELVETASGKAAVAAITSRTAGECAAKK